MKHAKMGCVDKTRVPDIIILPGQHLGLYSCILPVIHSCQPHILSFYYICLVPHYLVFFLLSVASGIDNNLIKWRMSKRIPALSCTITIRPLRQQWYSFSSSSQHQFTMFGKWSGKEHGSSQRSLLEESVSDFGPYAYNGSLMVP